MKQTMNIIDLLARHGIKPTANRIVIAETMAAADYPMSMKEIEVKLQTIDKSSVFRSLTLFREKHLVHQVEDGNDVVRYELCLSDSHEEDDDMHVHFYCEFCHRTYCLPELLIPEVKLPEGYLQTSINYMVKGRCPSCAKKKVL